MNDKQLAVLEVIRSNPRTAFLVFRLIPVALAAFIFLLPIGLRLQSLLFVSVVFCQVWRLASVWFGLTEGARLFRQRRLARRAQRFFAYYGKTGKILDNRLLSDMRRINWDDVPEAYETISQDGARAI